jgi:hypothetical protein
MDVFHMEFSVRRGKKCVSISRCSRMGVDLIVTDMFVAVLNICKEELEESDEGTMP